MNAFVGVLSLFLVFSSFFVPWTAASAAPAAGIITNLSGVAWIDRNGDRLKAAAGQSLLPDDALILEANSHVRLLAYSGCDEWAASGPDTIRLDSAGVPVSEKRRDLTLTGTLDICFDPASFTTVSYGRLGGVTVRSDMVSKQRIKADDGHASAAELLTIVLFDLKNDQPDKARPYFDMLRQQLPKGPLMDSLADHFKSP